MSQLYEKGSRVGGFVCTSVYEVNELNGRLFEFEHEISKAKLLYMATNDNNKLFSVAFRTIPSNDTGVFHILEHSVLCGSKKFPVKEPFVELLKSSMNTFLNAMTASDKTIYPVSSRNEKDFLNLTEVYLDAVFAPAIYENDSIFRQEGWHYELRDAKDAASIKGVVFNEMKGTESDVNRLSNNEMMRILFKDSCYYYISGGASEAIPTLTYEEFIANHKKYYCPRNAIFYLEGDMDIAKPVALMEEYLQTAPSEQDKDYSDIADPTVAKACTVVKYYPISEEEEEAERSQVILGKLLWDYSEKNKMYAASLLSDYLTESNAAPLNKLILENGLGQDVRFVVEDGIKQGYMKLKVINTEADRKDEIKAKVLELVHKLAEEGLDKKALEAAINQTEFNMKEIDEPRGLYHNMSVLSSYAYGGDPTLFLTYDESFAFLREQLKTDYYEKLLLEMFDEEELVTLVMVPSKTLAADREAAEKERVRVAQTSWSEMELQEILALNEKLDAWQLSEDSKEQLASIPTLALSDVNELPEKRITNEIKVGDTTVLLHPTDVSGVAYISMYFPVPAKYQKNISQLSFLTDLYKEIATGRPLNDLLADIKMNLGALDFNLTAIAKEAEMDTCTAYFEVKCSVLKDRMEDAVRLIKEVIFETDFTQKDAIKDYLLQVIQLFRNAIIANGHRMGMKKAASSFTVQNSLAEAIDGVTCYQYFKNLSADYDSKADEFLADLQMLVKDTLVQDQMILSFAAMEKELQSADFLKEYHVEELINIFPKRGELVDISMKNKLPKANCTFIQIPSAVGYASAATNLKLIGDEYRGSWRVATKISSLAYLWNVVRVQGGAYGAGLAVGPAGNLSYYSYRDPKGARSLEKYKETGNFLRDYLAAGEKFENFIISGISDTEPLLSPKDNADFADLEYLRGMGYEFSCRIRKEMLELTEEELLACADTMDRMWENVSVCYIGPDASDFDVDEKIDL